MELNNIVPFENFRKLLEEASIPDEFSNATKFSQCLVGRGLFSILRYFKQGIDIGRLEYLKRKLENEYFAGWLRYCAIKKINIKDGSWSGEQPSVPSEEEGGGGQPVPPTEEVEYPFICEVLNMDYAEDNMNVLAQTINKFREFVKTIEEQLNEGGIEEEDLKELKEMLEQAKLAVKYGDLKLKINKDVFSVLVQHAQITGVTFDQEKEKLIVDKLEEVKAFLNGGAKACKDYHLTENEKKVIDVLNTSTNEPIKIKCKEINTLISGEPIIAQPQPEQQEPEVENVIYHFEDLLLEEITSKLNPKVPIMQVLGDTLNTVPGGTSGSTTGKVKPYEYLKSIGINSVDEIDFVKCAQLFSQHPEFKEGATKLITTEGVKKIQYAAARMIFRAKKTPTYQGITPATGGGLSYEEDTNLRTVWERKVEAVKGEWTYFINVEVVDPFRLMNLQDAYRRRNPELDEYYKRMNNTTVAINATNVIDEGGMGLRLFKGTEWSTENLLFVMQYMIGTDKYYPVFQLYGGGRNRPNAIYRYIGNIDIDRIIKENKNKDPNFSREAKDYASCILDINNYKQKGDKKFNDRFFRGDIRYMPGKQNYLLDGVYLASRHFDRINPSQTGTPRTRNTRFLYFYVESNKLRNGHVFDELKGGQQFTDKDFKLMTFYQDNIKEIGLTQLMLKPEIIVSSVGSFFQFESKSWEDAYFPGMSSKFYQAQKLTTPVDCNTGDRLNGIISLK